MRIEELKKHFIVDETSLKANLEELIEKTLPFCVVDTKGKVHLKTNALTAKAKIKLILVARSIASQLDESVSAEVTIEDMADATGIPGNQVRARVKDVVDERFALLCARGTYKVNSHQISGFLDELSGVNS